MAAQKLIHSIKPKKLNGVVILVQLASVESFLGRSAYKSPVDGKNLNRTFPGSKNGTNTEKVAAFITEHIIARSNYFLDIHSGDAPEDLISYGAYYSNSDLPGISAKGKAMAISLGFDHVVKFNTDGKGYMAKGAPSLYCTAEAFKREIPSIDIECGRLGIVEQSAVDKVETSVLNLLTNLNFVSSHSKPLDAKPPLIISNRIYIASRFDGIFYPAKKAGDLVKTAMKFGHVTDFFGKTLQTVYAESDGLLMLIISTLQLIRERIWW